MQYAFFSLFGVMCRLWLCILIARFFMNFWRCEMLLDQCLWYLYIVLKKISENYIKNQLLYFSVYNLILIAVSWSSKCIYSSSASNKLIHLVCSYADGYFSVRYKIYFSRISLYIACCWRGINIRTFKGQELFRKAEWNILICIKNEQERARVVWNLTWLLIRLHDFQFSHCFWCWLQTSSKTINKLAHPNAPLGYGLCFLNLAFDGFTNATQDSLKSR